jgi:hypothetical protein
VDESLNYASIDDEYQRIIILYHQITEKEGTIRVFQGSRAEEEPENLST